MLGRSLIFVAVLASLVGVASHGVAQAASIESIKARGRLVCPVPTAPYPAFTELDDKGVWRGISVDICRAVATAILGSPDKAEFTPISWANRIPALQSGTVDIVTMLTDWSRSRDVKLGLQFSNPYFFAGSMLMVPSSLKIGSVKDLGGATICGLAGSTVGQNASSYLSSIGVKHELLTFDKSTDSNFAYKNGRCEATVQFGPSNVIFRANELEVNAHVILPEVIGLNPDAVVVRQGDEGLLDIVNWTLAALVQAQILGITSDNVDSIVADPNTGRDQKRLLGMVPGVGDGFGLDDKWAYRVIKLNGNYGQLYDRSLGEGTRYKIPSGLNQPWTKGGMLFSPVFDRHEAGERPGGEQGRS